jgi:isopropylmalate/homocitrate/citramalate synthase
VAEAATIGGPPTGTEGEGPPPVVVVSDTTLRDGEQMPGVVFNQAEKIRIARLLVELGVPLIEAGFPAVSDLEAEAIREVVQRCPDSVVQVIARPLDRDVDAAVGTGAHSIAVFLGTSDAHLESKLRMSVDDAERAVAAAVRRAKRAGRQVVFAAEDATRSRPEVLLRVCTAAADAGADALGVADTVGIATPTSMAELVRTVMAGCPLPLAVHCHNDLGLATANSLAAVAAGASGIQCSVLGIGERAGNAPLEQVALALQVALGRAVELDLTRLQPLAEYVAGLIGVPIAPYQPVAGGNAFTHESGLHVDGLVRDATTYEPYPPELVGRERRIVLGKHSGLSSVLAVAQAGQIDLDGRTARSVLAHVKASAQLGQPVGRQDAERLVRQLAEVADTTR